MTTHVGTGGGVRREPAPAGRHHHRRFPGIGAGLVAAYRAQGWNVVATARAMKSPDDPGVLASRATSPTPPPRADRQRSLEHFGRIDTLVNNAGVYLSKLFTDYTAEDYAQIVGVNLSGFFWLTQRAITEMLRCTAATWSTSPPRSPTTRTPARPRSLTALTKGGVAAATRSLAVEYASRGIRVNAVSPGMVQRRRTRRKATKGLGDRLPPLGHVGQVSDVVGGILFLEASPFITGEILHIDGGQNAGR